MSDGELPRIQAPVEIVPRVQPTGQQRERQKKKRPSHDAAEDVVEVGGDEEPDAEPETPQLDAAEGDDDGLDLRV